MGYIKQGENIIAWGQVGFVNKPQVITTQKGNIQVRTFSICVGTNENNEKQWKSVECWGMQALREDIKQWQTALILGREIEKPYTNKEGEQAVKKFIRADFISINNTSDGFATIQKQKQDEAKDIEELGNDQDLPF